MRNRFFVLIAAVAALAVSSPAAPFFESTAAATTSQPNLIFVLTDDQRFDSMSVMPATKQLFQVKFPEAIVTTSNCCPSRSTYLTGEYVHNTTVFNNAREPYLRFDERIMETIGPWLQEQGYRTALLGKYFNSFLPEADAAPAGWDEFYGNAGLGVEGPNKNSYTHFILRERYVENGQVVDAPKEYTDTYQTTLLSDLADRFIRRSLDPAYNPEGKPFALFIWTKAPHAPETPDEKYKQADVPAPERVPSFMEPDMSDKPKEVRSFPYVIDDPSWHYQNRQGQMRTLMSVDDMNARLFATLDEVGLRDETWGFYASDNGSYFGEHRLLGKQYGYEEGIRIPFRMAVPGYERATIRALVTNADVTPTLLDLAGALPSDTANGDSLVPLIEGADPDKFRKHQLIEGFSGDRTPAWFEFAGLRNDKWKYIRWKSGSRELYNLITDPYELDNLAGKKKQQDRIDRFDVILDRMLAE